MRRDGPDMLSRPEFGNGAIEPAMEPAVTALSVSDLNRRARGLLERGFPLLWVRGEITGFMRAASGHVYFSLKDANAQVRCAMWRGKAAGLSFEAKNGDAVEVRANVTLFEARGEYQLSVEVMRRAGAGALFEQFLRLKEKLEREGLFDAAHKRALPPQPRGIGIVTSPQAAALRDVVTTLKRRAPMIPLVLYPTPVQGAGAAGLIAAAIDTASARARDDGIDLLIVCRGGGSMEDLWPFNEEIVARAIAGCSIPVVCGVGHETDFSIADWVADLRAPTPTAAAELASPDIEDLRAALAGIAAALKRAMADRLGSAQQRVDWLARALTPPAARLAWQRQRLAYAATRLSAAALATLTARRARAAHARARLRVPDLARRHLQIAHGRKRLVGAAVGMVHGQEALLERLSGSLEMLNPQRVLERGFAMVSDANGQVVTDAALLAPGTRLDVTLAKGGASVSVEQTRAGSRPGTAGAGGAEGGVSADSADPTRGATK